MTSGKTLREQLIDVIRAPIPSADIRPSGAMADKVLFLIEPMLERLQREGQEAGFRAARAETDLTSLKDSVGQLLEDWERDAAAIDRVKNLAINARRTGCGAGWDLDPLAVLAALAPTQPEEGTDEA